MAEDWMKIDMGLLGIVKSQRRHSEHWLGGMQITQQNFVPPERLYVEMFQERWITKGNAGKRFVVVEELCAKALRTL